MKIRFVSGIIFGIALCFSSHEAAWGKKREKDRAWETTCCFFKKEQSQDHTETLVSFLWRKGRTIETREHFDHHRQAEEGYLTPRSHYYSTPTPVLTRDNRRCTSKKKVICIAAGATAVFIPGGILLAGGALALFAPDVLKNIAPFLFKTPSSLPRTTASVTSMSPSQSFTDADWITLNEEDIRYTDMREQFFCKQPHSLGSQCLERIYQTDLGTQTEEIPVIQKDSPVMERIEEKCPDWLPAGSYSKIKCFHHRCNRSQAISASVACQPDTHEIWPQDKSYAIRYQFSSQIPQTIQERCAQHIELLNLHLLGFRQNTEPYTLSIYVHQDDQLRSLSQATLGETTSTGRVVNGDITLTSCPCLQASLQSAEGAPCLQALSHMTAFHEQVASDYLGEPDGTGQNFFIGAHTKKVYGGPVPLELTKDGWLRFSGVQPCFPMCSHPTQTHKISKFFWTFHKDVGFALIPEKSWKTEV